MTNPINMSVLPIDGQCLIGDGKSFAAVRSSPMWSVAGIDSYEAVCDDGGQCFVAAGAMTEGILRIAVGRARALERENKLAEAAAVYQALGDRCEKEMPEKPDVTAEYYGEAGRLYGIAKDAVSSARAYVAAAKVARKAGLKIAFDYTDSAADAYLEAAKQGTREVMVSRFSKAFELLQMQTQSVLAARAKDGPSELSYKIEIDIYQRQVVALLGIESTGFIPLHSMSTMNRDLIRRTRAGLIDAYRRMGDAHVELGELNQAADAYSKQRGYSNSKHLTMLSIVNAKDQLWGRVRGVVVHLSRDRVVRVEDASLQLAKIFKGKPRKFEALLGDDRSWLNHLLRDCLDREFIPVFKDHARRAFGAKVK